MKVTGFSFIKNAIKFDYPIVESILSILPICDEFVIAVGDSEDDTLELIKNINSPKIKIINTVWDNSLRQGGRVLADETNKAYEAISNDTDWCFYIQGDEVMHEDDLQTIKDAMLKYNDDKKVQGLVFEHLNFYGSYDFIASSRHWHKREVRVIRKDKNITSYKDAMSFRFNGKKLNCKYVPATIYHYGWVKNPATQLEKRKTFEKFWHDDETVKQKFDNKDVFDYNLVDEVARFTGSHPKIIKERIDNVNWEYSFDPTIAPKLTFIKKTLNLIYQKTGIHIGEFKNYNLI